MPPAAAPLICLASASPRRRELLEQLGVPYTVSAADIDEAVEEGEAAADYVLRVARAKARTVRLRGTPLPVLAADTTVVVDGLICAKPRDRADAIAMLQRLSGRTHQVLTAVALASLSGIASRLSASEVRLRSVTPAECAAYWETGEPHDKAGGYAIQGRGALFIEHLSGSYSGVMGLPLYETGQLLSAAGVACLPVIGTASAAGTR
ncbi:MAG TPA: Maf family protein [Steroidobacteraceae bacterium]|jgi:septum formation protein|nr:Maf family protein [Steroidobacteraceae bacterium]